MFTRIHHVGLVVSAPEKAKRLWVDTYGFKVDESRSPLFISAGAAVLLLLGTLAVLMIRRHKASHVPVR